MISESSWWVYMLRCSDGTLYTGITNNLDKRLAAHMAGKVKYTRSKLPVTITYTEQFGNRSQALKREYFIKQQTKTWKEATVEEWTGINKK
jgi:putative endonuclease